MSLFPPSAGYVPRTVPGTAPPAAAGESAAGGAGDPVDRLVDDLVDEARLTYRCPWCGWLIAWCVDPTGHAAAWDRWLLQPRQSGGRWRW